MIVDVKVKRFTLLFTLLRRNEHLFLIHCCLSNHLNQAPSFRDGCKIDLIKPLVPLGNDKLILLSDF